jgi:RNA-directed DNA polymerase
VGNYRYFTVHDPKKRTICAAQFRERVLQHALMNLCEPVLERAAIFDSYACRKGKGQLLAVRRAESYARAIRMVFLKP